MGKTWIDAEELAYNKGLWRSNRKGYVKTEWGFRMCKLGVPDTFFTIPALVKHKGKVIRGYVALGESNEFVFHPNQGETP
jgi:hypothetical protein